MAYAKPHLTKIFLATLTVVQAFAGIIGNASLLVVIARFKSLRTVCNLLIANLAVVDMLNATISMPFFLLYTVLQVDWFRGPNFAFVITFSDRLFTVLNVASMLSLLANMYFATAFDLKYYAWKSNKKAMFCCCMIWFIGIVVSQLTSLPIYSMTLGDAPVTEYRAEIFKQTRLYLAVIVAFFFFCGSLLGGLTIYGIRKKNEKVI